MSETETSLKSCFRLLKGPQSGGIRFQIPKRNKNMNQGPGFNQGPSNRGRGRPPMQSPPTQCRPLGGKRLQPDSPRKDSNAATNGAGPADGNNRSVMSAAGDVLMGNVIF